MHVLVCGGRDYEGQSKVNAVLDLAHRRIKITRIIHGKATGADTWAMEWARSRRIVEIGYEPDWDRYGNYAGNVRNQQMLNQERVDLTIAFPGGSGTRDMVARSREASIKVIRIKR